VAADVHDVLLPHEFHLGVLDVVQIKLHKQFLLLPEAVQSLSYVPVELQKSSVYLLFCVAEFPLFQQKKRSQFVEGFSLRLCERLHYLQLKLSQPVSVRVSSAPHFFMVSPRRVFTNVGHAVVAHKVESPISFRYVKRIGIVTDSQVLWHNLL